MSYILRKSAPVFKSIAVSEVTNGELETVLEVKIDLLFSYKLSNAII